MTSLTGSRGNTGYASQSGTGSTLPQMKRPHGYQTGQNQNFTPQQLQLLQQMFGFVGPDSDLFKMASGDQSFYDQLEAPAQRGFSEQLGGLASRFTGFGGQGSLSSRNSSGFQNSATAAASNFQQDLQAQRLGLSRQALMDLRGMANELMGQRPYENYLVKKREKQPSGWGGVAGAGVGGAAGFFGSGGNPMVALQGAQLGYNVGSAF